MGNSGAALSEPTAASYFNPSLLNRKTKDSYSLNGSTLGTLSSKSDQVEATSFALNPGYLGTILVGDALVHEIFIVNTSPSQLKIAIHLNINDSDINFEETRNQNQFIFGYSMAFKEIPFALSYFGQYSQIDGTSFSELTSLTSNLRSTSSTKLDYKSLGAGVSASGHTAFGNYTLGYNYRSRQLILFKKDQETVVSYIHGATSVTSYQKIESSNSNSHKAPNGAFFVIGHGFVSGDHEFTTDSQFQENDELNNTFKMIQTFGYKMNSKSGHQFLVGINHQLGSEVSYFGQSTYYSVGYSWLKNSLRSVLGGYVYTSRISQDVFAAGLSFGSEFNY